MPILIRITLVIALGGLLFGANPVQAKALEDRDWIEVRTVNFRLLSALGEKKSIELVRQLETFRRVIVLVANVANTASAIPTEILAVRDAGDFKRIGAPKKAAGLFRPGLRRNLILIRDYAGIDEVPVIVHEYVHFLLGGRGRINYPRWYNEGLAEYLSAPQNREGAFVVGAINETRANYMFRVQWIPFREILAPEDLAEWSTKKVAMFYAQSWALVHYLHHRPERATLAEDMARYIELLESGEDGVRAFERAFRIAEEDLDREVRRYFGEKDLGASTIPAYILDIDDIVPDFEPEIRKVSREQVSFALGKAALGFGELDSAQHWFTIAAEDDSQRARATAGLGDALKFDEQFEAARPHFEKAIELAPDDPYCQLDAAEFWHDWARETESDEDRAAYLARARHHYVKAWKLDDTMPETYAMYGDTFVLAGERLDTGVEMLETAEALLPSSVPVRFMLAKAYKAAGRREDAIRAAQSVLAWIHEDSDAAKEAREIVTELTETAE